MVRKSSYKVQWEESALNYLVEQLDYVSKSSVDAPVIIKKGILSKLNAIKINPFIFEADKLKDGNDGTYRAFVLYSYRITYRVSEKTITIIRVRHTSQEPLKY